METNPLSPEPAACPRCGAPASRRDSQGRCRRCLARYSLLSSAAAVDATDSGLRTSCPECGRRIKLAEGADVSDLHCDSCGARFSIVAAPEAAESAARLDRLGQFEILAKLGAGASGTVWKARDTRLDRLVAIKVPRRGQLEPEQVQKFLREARAATQLRHPNIVSVFEVGRREDLVYIVCDFVDGVPLADRLAGKHPWAPRDAAELCRRLAAALEHAHGQGVIHRDIKPGNILMDASGEPHLTDFGLARRAAGEVTLTLDGQLLGTPAYMSPEQARGEAHQADPRTDLYSLGVVLFQLLTGKRPFRGDLRTLVHQVIHDQPPRPRQLAAHVPRDLDTICLKCLEKDPARRYASARELGEDLDRFLAGKPIRARPVGPAGRAWRWCRRKPALAAMTAALALLLGANLTRMFNQPLRTGAGALEERAQSQLAPQPPVPAAPTDTHHVWLGSPDPKPPYSTWRTAAHVIQDAVDAASVGDKVLVTNGTYLTGGRASLGGMSNRVAVEKPLVLRSVNGPGVTLIVGAKPPGGTNGPGAVRCVALANGARLEGFTLSNGATLAHYAKTGAGPETAGGGVWCASTNALVMNCTLTANRCSALGAGAYGTTLSNCMLIGNVSGFDGGGAAQSALSRCTIVGNAAGADRVGKMPIGGGAWASTLSHCIISNNTSTCEAGGAGQSKLDHCTLVANRAPYGGGSWASELSHCILSNNAASDVGGGALCGLLRNCVVTGNTAANAGGGALGGWQGEASTLHNCTMTGNSAPVGGGAADCTLNNCIVYANTAPDGPNYSGGTLNNCCTTPLPVRGDFNLTADPQLADAAHISPSSPCRRAGSARYTSGTDIDGEPWLDPPSIGCDEVHLGANRR